MSKIRHFMLPFVCSSLKLAKECKGVIKMRLCIILKRRYFKL